MIREREREREEDFIQNMRDKIDTSWGKKKGKNLRKWCMHIKKRII